MKKRKLIEYLLLSVMLAGCGASKESISNSKEESSTPTISEKESESVKESTSSVETSSDSLSPSESISPSESSPSESSPSESVSESSSEIVGQEYEIYSGDFAFGDNGTAESLQANSIAVCTNDTFNEGTLSFSITPNAVADSGIIFGLSFPSGYSTFWEGEGISYYFLFVSLSGTLYLGKTDSGSWTICQNKYIDNFNINTTYNVSVSYDKSLSEYDSITCFLNGIEYFTYADDAKLTGTMYGYRAGSANASYSKITKSDEKYIVDSEKVNDYYLANGKFSYADGIYKSTENNSIAFDKENSFSLGTLEATVKIANSASDNGIIFGLTPSKSGMFWEASVSYYFFFINLSGYAFLGKVNNGTWSNCVISNVVSGYKLGGTYNLKVERGSAETILCYVDDVLYCSYTDDVPLDGDKYGIRAGGTGVEFSNIKYNNTGKIEYGEPENYDVISGGFIAMSETSIRANKANSLALNNELELEKGTFGASMISNGNLAAGFIFNADSELKNYYYYYIKGQYIYLDKITNGTAKTLGSCYVTAGYSKGSSYPYKVIFDEGNIKCFFRNNLYITYQDDSPLDGTLFGLYTKNNNSVFAGIKASEDTTFNGVETLVFGHSYMELWDNYASDLAEYESIANIGIGGSVASHWVNLKDEVVAYQPTRGIYMIGINDLTAGVSPKAIVNDVKTLLLAIKEEIPEFEVALVSVNKCTARETIRKTIAETNVLYKQLAASYDWIYYANVDEAFTDSNGNPIASCFTDGLHPTAASYKVIAQAIYDAFANKDQPGLDEEDQAKIFEEAKQAKLDAIDLYSKNAFDLATWENAKEIYEQACNKINTCTSVEELNNLDLSNEINQLKVYKNISSLYVKSIVESDNRFLMNSGTGWTLDEDGYVTINDIGLAMDQTYELTDFDFTFTLKQIQGETSYASILFRANKNYCGGVDGYLINIVTGDNYLQIWHLTNQYTANTAITPEITYIGGWVFPNEVEDTKFRAKVKGSYIYLYTEEDYEANGSEYGLAVDLTNGGQFALYEKGYTGFVIINDGVKCKIAIEDVISSEIREYLELQATEEGKLQLAKEEKLKDLDASGVYAYNDDDAFEVVKAYNDLVTAIENAETISALDAIDTKAFKEAVTTLATKKSNADHFNEEILEYPTLSKWSLVNDHMYMWSNQGTILTNSVGYAISPMAYDSDMSFAFTVSASTDVAICGILVANYNETYDGLDGYLFNLVANANQQYVQVYYLNNAYNSYGPSVCDYIGGWVYNDGDGMVIGTKFRCIIKDGIVSIYNDASYEARGTAAGHVDVDLSVGGSKTVADTYHLGLLNWEGKEFYITMNSISTINSSLDGTNEALCCVNNYASSINLDVYREAEKNQASKLLADLKALDGTYDEIMASLKEAKETIASLKTNAQYELEEKDGNSIHKTIMSNILANDATKSSWALVTEHTALWEVNEGTITTKANSDGWQITKDTYEDFEMYFKITGATNTNPYGNFVSKGIIIGGSIYENDTQYFKGYVINISVTNGDDWFQVHYIDGSAGVGSTATTFIGGVNGNFDGKTLKIKISDKKLYVYDENGTPLANLINTGFQTVSYLDLTNYEAGGIGIVNWDTKGSTFEISSFIVEE